MTRASRQTLARYSTFFILQPQGKNVTITFDGPDEKAAATAVEDLFADGFGDFSFMTQKVGILGIPLGFGAGQTGSELA